MMNKKKIINDPVYGFLTIPGELIYDLIEHPFFQRLRRIRQLGMSEYVYPGAVHTRFHHALGAVNLMIRSLDILKQKGIEISDKEYEAACAAILLHDIGHGPFSHTLEHALVKDISHEKISRLLMQELNKQFNGQLELAISIFDNDYSRPFFHQLVSGQLDMDRLDYLSRDSFYTGVHEGIVSADRIINMLYVVNNEIVLEEKGIYSIEKFIVARRLMYWQVYLHKTVLAAELLLRQILRRATEVLKEKEIFTTPFLGNFLKENPEMQHFESSPEWIERFTQLDDNDIMVSIKVWQYEDDKLLSMLSKQFIERRLPKIILRKAPFSKEEIEDKRKAICKLYALTTQEADYFVQTGSVENNAYKQESLAIKVLRKDGKVCDVAEISDNYNLEPLRTTVKKYYLSFYRE